MAFITENRLYYYRIMPFGLKNTGATYQRLVNKVFADKIGRSMEIYMDDMCHTPTRKSTSGNPRVSLNGIQFPETQPRTRKVSQYHIPFEK